MLVCQLVTFNVRLSWKLATRSAAVRALVDSSCCLNIRVAGCWLGFLGSWVLVLGCDRHHLVTLKSWSNFMAPFSWSMAIDGCGHFGRQRSAWVWWRSRSTSMCRTLICSSRSNSFPAWSCWGFEVAGCLSCFSKAQHKLFGFKPRESWWKFEIRKL